ncbi:MAG TPA: GntR family transcriptional regulator [Anaerolineae bacterium]|nr:GntR family transcriptional regulator [Anaerolineae bacterium]
MSPGSPLSSPIKRQTLAERVAETIREAILLGDLEPGAGLPTEPELAAQFGVSRAVVRDATRILMAQGLVDVQHGKGVFVTGSQTEAFGQALLLALRRAGASAWDVEQFEQLLLPEALALAATSATEEDVKRLGAAIEAYSAQFADYQARWARQEPLHGERDRLREGFGPVRQALLDATHNEVLRQLGPALLRLRALRSWVAEDEDPAQAAEAATHAETAYLQAILQAVIRGDPDEARATMKRLLRLPPEAIDAMRGTPVGETPVIPISIDRWAKQLRES